MKEGRQDGTDGRGRGKEEEDEGASEEERKEGRRSGNLFARTRNWFWFSFSGWTDGGPAARRAAAAAIIERGIHAFCRVARRRRRPRTPYGRCINSAFLPHCCCHYIHSRRRWSHPRIVVLRLCGPTDRHGSKRAAPVQFATSCTVELPIQRRAGRGGGDGQRGAARAGKDGRRADGD